MLTFLESLSSDFDKNMNAIDLYYENAKSQYLLELKNAETLVMTESYDEDQLSYLYEQAEETFGAQIKKSITALKETIVKFCTNIKNKIGSSKDNKMSDYERDIKTNPFMKKGEIKIDDTRQEISVCEKYTNKLKNLSLKAKSGRYDKSSVAELKSEYESERKKAIAAGAGVAISIPVAYTLWKNHTDKADKNIQKISDEGIGVTDCPHIEIAQLGAQIAKDHSSAILKLVGSLQGGISKFVNSVKGKQKSETEVIKESVDESIISESEFNDFNDTDFNEILSDIVESVMNQHDEVVVLEAAKFTVLPKFKKMTKLYPELGKHTDLIKEAELLAAEQGEKTTNKETLIKIGKVVVRILGVIQGVESAVLVPFCVLIFPIISLLISRFWKFVFDLSEFALAEQQSLEMISKLSDIKKKTDDKEVKKRCEKLIDKLKENMDDLKTESVDSDFSSVMELSDDDKLSFINMYLKESETEFAMETCNSINQFLKDKKTEVITDIMEDVMDDHLSNSFESVEIY